MIYIDEIPVQNDARNIPETSRMFLVPFCNPRTFFIWIALQIKDYNTMESDKIYELHIYHLIEEQIGAKLDLN